jgi:hypothetical protein
MKTIVFFLLMTSALAQHSEQPVKENSSDQREEIVVFSIEEVGKNKTWYLESSPSFTNVLRIKEKDEELVRKIDGREAQKLDRDFAARFLKCQYEIAAVDGDCKVTLRLTMKGESQDICEKDDRKSQEIAPFVEDLSKRF